MVDHIDQETAENKPDSWISRYSFLFLRYPAGLKKLSGSCAGLTLNFYCGYVHNL